MTETGAGEAACQLQHPDDAAVAEVRTWLEGAHNETLIELEAHTLRGVLAVLDGWERNAKTAAAQRDAAYSELDSAKVDMRMLRVDRDVAIERAEKAEAALDRVRRQAQHPRASAGLIRDFVYAADILALIDQPETT